MDGGDDGVSGGDDECNNDGDSTDALCYTAMYNSSKISLTHLHTQRVFPSSIYEML